MLFHKIASRSVSARLLKVLPLLIDKDQSCGVPGRFIAENVAFTRDAVDHCFLFGVPVSLICLDQEKAFDRIGPFSFPWALTPFLLNGWTWRPSSFLSFSCFFFGCMQRSLSGLWLWCWFLLSFLLC